MDERSVKTAVIVSHITTIALSQYLIIAGIVWLKSKAIEWCMLAILGIIVLLPVVFDLIICMRIKKNRVIIKRSTHFYDGVVLLPILFFLLDNVLSSKEIPQKNVKITVFITFIDALVLVERIVTSGMFSHKQVEKNQG